MMTKEEIAEVTIRLIKLELTDEEVTIDSFLDRDLYLTDEDLLYLEDIIYHEIDLDIDGLLNLDEQDKVQDIVDTIFESQY